MPLVIKESEGHFEPAPPGLHQAVCVDVVDLGIVPGKYGPKAKLRLIWQLKTRNKKGERFQVRATYTQSLGESSNLRKDLESWRGRSFTQEELENFDVEKLLGINCQLSLKQEKSKSTGRLYAKVTAVLEPLKGAAHELTAEKYEREPWAGESKVYEADPEPEFTDETSDSVPF